jgi:hypothetical protein
MAVPGEKRDDEDDAGGQLGPTHTPLVPGQLTPHQVALVSDARDEYLKMVGSEAAYQVHIQRIERWTGILDVLSFLLAVWTVFILWVVGDRSSRLHDVMAIIGTGLSLAVGSLVVCSWRFKWGEQVLKKQELSREAHDLIARYEAMSAESTFNEIKLAKWNKDRLAFYEREKHPLAVVWTRCQQLGFQHVGLRFPTYDIKCHACGRIWNELKNKRRGWRNGIWFLRCENCGVQR